MNSPISSPLYNCVSGHSETDSVIKEIENMEQLVLQHIRTAGIIKSKETSLVDEILVVRRQRRRIISDLLSQISKIYTEKEMIQNEILQRSEYQIQEITQRKDNEIEKIISTNQFEISNLNQQHSTTLKSEVSKLQRKYELKLEELEIKFNEIKQSNFELKNKLKNDNHKKIIDEQQQLFTIKTERYREALRTVTEREKALVLQNNGYIDKIHSLETENNTLKMKISQLESHIEEYRQSDAEKGSRMAAIQSKYQKVKEQTQSLTREAAEAIDKLRSEKTEEIQKLKSEHDQALQSIDDRVRKALHAKENRIQVLQENLKEKQNKINEMQKLFDYLNKDLSGGHL